MQVSDDTRSSAIEISLGADNVALGDYTCTASYHPNTSLAPSPATGTFSVQLESESNVNGIIYAYLQTMPFARDFVEVLDTQTFAAMESPSTLA